MVAIEDQATGLTVVAAKDNVPDEVAVTDLVSFIPLRENPEEWAEFIINKYNEVEVDRVKYNAFTKTAGFDINHTVEQLCEYYADLPAER